MISFQSNMRPISLICEISAQNQYHCIHHHRPTKLSKFHPFFTISVKFDYSPMSVILLLAVFVSCKINRIAREADSANNGAKEMTFGSPDGGVDGEYSGAGFMKTS